MVIQNNMPDSFKSKLAQNKKNHFDERFLRMFCCLKGVLLMFFTLICISECQLCYAQNEMQYGGTANLPIIVNPGSAGKSGAVEAIGAFRKQWTGFKGSPQTTLLSVDAEVKFLGNFHGVGASVYNDTDGPLTTMNINASYSYHIDLSKGLLGLGLRVGVMNVAFKLSDLKPSVDGGENDYHQSSDMALQGSDSSGSAFDAGVGAYYQSDASYVGFSLLHVNAPSVELNSGAKIKSRPLMTVGASRKLETTGTVSFEPSMFFKTDFASWQMEVIGAADFRKVFSAGLGYRLQDAIFFPFWVNLSNGLRVGYTYDLCVSALHRYNGGSHELAASYTFNIDVEKRNKRYKSVRIL